MSKDIKLFKKRLKFLLRKNRKLGKAGCISVDTGDGSTAVLTSVRDVTLSDNVGYWVADIELAGSSFAIGNPGHGLIRLSALEETSNVICDTVDVKGMSHRGDTVNFLVQNKDKETVVSINICACANE